MLFSDLTSAYCLNNLNVDSNGIAKQVYPSLLGKYKKLKRDYIWKHVSNEIYIYWYSYSLLPAFSHWRVSIIIQGIIPIFKKFLWYDSESFLFNSIFVDSNFKLLKISNWTQDDPGANPYVRHSNCTELIPTRCPSTGKFGEWKIYTTNGLKSDQNLTITCGK